MEGFLCYEFGGLLFGGKCTWTESEYYFYSLIREFIHLTLQDKLIFSV